MKWVILTGVFSLLWSANLVASTGEIRPGDSREQVEAVLGAPSGWIQGGTYQLLLYDRGSVEIRDGAVSKVEIVSAEEHERRLRERAIRAAERRETEEALRAQRIEKGNALKDRTVADADFLSSPPEAQLRFWSNFKQNYPEVPAEFEYRDALSAYERDEDARRAERELQMAAQQLARLEVKAEKAEREAEKAEERAERAERRRRSVVYSGYSPPCVNAYPAAPRIEYFSTKPGYLPGTIGSGIGNRSLFRQTYSAGHTYGSVPLVNSGGLTIHVRN